MRIAIVGAGMAGLSCAEGLVKIGHEVTLLDKARGPGGRMSTRRMDTPMGPISFDHGAQYFTARDPGFSQQVRDWADQGVVANWPLPDPNAWVGTPGMNTVIKAMAEGHAIHWNVHVDRVERHAEGWSLSAGAAIFAGYDALVLAIPAEQALPFLSLHDFSMAREAMLARSQPCWTAMFAFDQTLPGGREMIRDTGNIGWAARNLAKPGRSGPEGWVVQARPEWSQAHIEDQPEAILAQLLAELAGALGIEQPVPIAVAAHRWRYAMCAGLGHGALWNAAPGLGLCADWLLGPRVESAWLSGQQLARTILEYPPQAAQRT